MTHTNTTIKTLRSLAMRSIGVLLAIGALAAGAASLRTAALAHFGVIAKAPAVEFEIRLPPALAGMDLKRDAQVELLTDHNQMLAQLDETLRATVDGRAVLHGRVPLKFRTSERMVVLSLPGQAQQAFKLRLPSSPGPSNDYGPWHLVDRVVSGTRAETRDNPDDTFAIRYRVL